MSFVLYAVGFLAVLGLIGWLMDFFKVKPKQDSSGNSMFD